MYIVRVFLLSNYSHYMKPSCCQNDRARKQTPTESALWIEEECSLCELSEIVGKRLIQYLISNYLGEF